jgi:hypothetical protein
MAHRLDGLQSIPAEVVIIITQYLTAYDYHKLRRVCKTWKILFSRLAQSLHFQIWPGNVTYHGETVLNSSYTTPSEPNNQHTFFNFHYEHFKDEFSFTFDLHEKMNASEFEAFRLLNEMEYGCCRDINFSPPLIIIEATPRENSIEFLHRMRHNSINIKDYSRGYWDTSLAPKIRHSCKDPLNRYSDDWRNLRTLLSSIYALKKSVISSEVNIPYDERGYQYSLYFRMPDGYVWQWTLEMKSEEKRYTHYNE